MVDLVTTLPHRKSGLETGQRHQAAAATRSGRTLRAGAGVRCRTDCSGARSDRSGRSTSATAGTICVSYACIAAFTPATSVVTTATIPAGRSCASPATGAATATITARCVARGVTAGTAMPTFVAIAVAAGTTGKGARERTACERAARST